MSALRAPPTRAFLLFFFSLPVVFHTDRFPRADILNDDYSLKRTIKMKHTTPAGLTVTSKSEHQKGVNGALEAKFFHAQSGVMVDKAKVLFSASARCVVIN